MTLEQQIQEDIKAAMKAKDNVALAATRAVKGEILLFKTSEGGSKEVTDADVLKMIQKLIKQRSGYHAESSYIFRNRLLDAFVKKTFFFQPCFQFFKVFRKFSDIPFFDLFCIKLVFPVPDKNSDRATDFHFQSVFQFKRKTTLVSFVHYSCRGCEAL